MKIRWFSKHISTILGIPKPMTQRDAERAAMSERERNVRWIEDTIRREVTRDDDQ